tara:strand:+ start:3809 stop:4351 length:543 start_codon:yes stop_codon:yes gene_type:complete
MNNLYKKFNKKLIIIFLSIICGFFVLSCGSFKKLESDRPTSAKEKARKNIEEGRGISIGNLRKGRSTTFDFSTSNPMWRASLETLDFLPLTTVDYSGGIIITDWYSDNNAGERESIKISLRFLDNDIRSESLKVIIHKKTCSANLSCRTTLLTNTKIKEELHTTILRRAALIEKESKTKK